MSKGALDEFLNRKPKGSPVVKSPAAENVSEDEAQDELDYRAFGANRNRRQVVMLDLRMLTGERLALAYSYLTSIFFDASGVIVLSYASHNVRIEGRNLEPLYDGLVSHAVRYIQQENTDLEKDVSEDETFVAEIELSET